MERRSDHTIQRDYGGMVKRNTSSGKTKALAIEVIAPVGEDRGDVESRDFLEHAPYS